MLISSVVTSMLKVITELVDFFIYLNISINEKII